MNFVYYIVRKRDQQILDGAEDVVSAINLANSANCACFIMQACVISEVGEDIELEVNSQDEDQENIINIEE